MAKKPHFSPTLCLTHDCNLNCIYCYQTHDRKAKMSLETAQKTIDWIFTNIPDDLEGVEIGFIGGEPLLEFELIKSIVEYTHSKKRENYIFYATTNGTVLTEEMKLWFSEHKHEFVLGLSIDGTRETHNHNRCNSFDSIDTGFFITNWPDQSVKMTLSEYSIKHLAKNIEFLHSLGFKEIGGVNLCEGTFDWSSDEYLKILAPQLAEIVNFYEKNNSLHLNQMLNRRLDFCEIQNRERRKWCGIGNGANFFDTDGKMYPCPFVTPMTFNTDELEEICKTDFKNAENFIDNDCFNNCYIYPICPYCAGANYLNKKTFSERDKSKCKIQKLITLFAAELQARKIINGTANLDDSRLYHTINAIQKIRELYLPEFSQYL